MVVGMIRGCNLPCPNQNCTSRIHFDIYQFWLGAQGCNFEVLWGHPHSIQKWWRGPICFMYRSLKSEIVPKSHVLFCTCSIYTRIYKIVQDCIHRASQIYLKHGIQYMSIRGAYSIYGYIGGRIVHDVHIEFDTAEDGAPEVYQNCIYEVRRGRKFYSPWSYKIVWGALKSPI